MATLSPPAKASSDENLRIIAHRLDTLATAIMASRYPEDERRYKLASHCATRAADAVRALILADPEHPEAALRLIRQAPSLTLVKG